MKFVYGPKPVNTRFRRAFTLLELLVVIMIIIVLAGITLRVTVFINRKMGINKTASDLERLRHALVEYHAAYGVFPPANSNNIRWAEIDRLPPSESPQHTTNCVDWVFTSRWPNVSMDFQCYTGLAYYLWSPDFAPDRARWSDYIAGLESAGSPPRSNRLSGVGGGWVFWTNNTLSCYDSWDRSYYYECLPPYQSFRLWSLGPDPTINSDDIGIQWSE